VALLALLLAVAHGTGAAGEESGWAMTIAFMYGAPALVLLIARAWRREDRSRYHWLIGLLVLDVLVAVNAYFAVAVLPGMAFSALAAFTGLGIAGLRKPHGDVPGTFGGASRTPVDWTPELHSAPAVPQPRPPEAPVDA
jgi:hypothetical protein